MRARAVSAWHRFLHSSVFKRGGELVIADQTLGRAVVIMYGLIVLWGVSSVVQRAPAISKLTTDDFQDWWALAISLTALVAFVGALFPLLQKLEFYSVISLGALISIYPGAVIILVFADQNEAISTIFLSGMILVVPAWRVVYLGRRIRRHRG